MGNYLLGGINGVGKSALFETIQQKRPDVNVVHTASALMERVGITPGNYDALRSLPDDYKNYHNGLLISDMITDLPVDQTTIFDAHYLNLIEGETKSTVVGDWPSLLSGIVLVEAEPTEVYGRIKASSRDRKLFPVDRVLSSGEELEIIEGFAIKTRQEFSRLAEAFMLPSAIIYNKDGYLEGAADQFLQFEQQIQEGAAT